MTEIEAYKFVHNQDEEDLIYENVKEKQVAMALGRIREKGFIPVYLGRT